MPVSKQSTSVINGLGIPLLNFISKRRHQLLFTCLAIHDDEIASRLLLARNDDWYMEAIGSLIDPEEFSDAPCAHLDAVIDVLETIKGLRNPLCPTPYHGKLYANMVKQFKGPKGSISNLEALSRVPSLVGEQATLLMQNRKKYFLNDIGYQDIIGVV